MNEYEVLYTMADDPMNTRHLKTIEAHDEDDAKEYIINNTYDDVIIISVSLVSD